MSQMCHQRKSMPNPPREGGLTSVPPVSVRGDRAGAQATCTWPRQARGHVHKFNGGRDGFREPKGQQRRVRKFLRCATASGQSLAGTVEHPAHPCDLQGDQYNKAEDVPKALVLSCYVSSTVDRCG